MIISVKKYWVLMNLPERPNEAPNLTDQGDEDSHTRSIGTVAIHSVRDEHSSDNLVAGGGNTNTHEWCHIVSGASIVELHQEDDKTNDAKCKAEVAQPQTVLWPGAVATQLAPAHGHPQIRHAATNLLANDGAHNDSDHLQAVLLRIEAEQLGEELRDFDGDHDARPQEFHGVGDGGEDDARVSGVRERLDKVIKGDWCRVDASETGVHLLEVGLVLFAFGLDAAADVARLGTEEEVENELDSVDLQKWPRSAIDSPEPERLGAEERESTYNGQDVVDPPVSDSEGDETKNERSNWDTKRHHNRPDTHELGSVFLEECLDDDTRANGSSWADEEGRDGSAKGHCTI